jgi:hypothetical protein
MSRKTVIAFSVLIFSPILIYFLWPSDENRIKKLFREGAKAIEEEKVEDVLSKVSFTYRDERGFSYLMIKEGLERTFQQMSGIKVEYEIKDLMVNGKTAAADLELRVIATYGQDTGYAIGDAAKPASMKFILEKERTKWLVSKTEGLPIRF